MAYSAIFTAEGTNLAEDDYRITINSTVSGTTPFTGTLAEQMFELSYSPTTDDLTGALVPSTAKIYIRVDPDEESTYTSFLEEVLTYQQSNAFLVLIERDSGSGYQDYWRGVLLQDQIKEVDSYAGVLVLTAVDGIALLKSQDFNFSNDVTSEPAHTTILSLIIDALSLGIDPTFWGASDNYLVTSVNWWEDGQTYGALLDPLTTQVFDLRAWIEIVIRDDGFGSLEFKTCFDVLKAIAEAYLARVYMANGHYVFEQIPMREDQNVKQVFYSRSGSKLTQGLNNLLNDISSSSTFDGSRLAGNAFTYFPALKKVEVVMKAYGSGFNNQMSLDASDYTDSQSKNFGYFDTDIGNVIAIGSVGQKLIIDIDFNVEFDWEYTPSDVVRHPTGLRGNIGIRPRCDIEIELNDVNSATNYYWNGYSWQTTQTSYTLYGADKIQSNVPASGFTTNHIRYRKSDNVTQVISTDNLPATGVVTITLDNYQAQYWDSLPNTWLNFTYSLVNPNNWGGLVELTLKTFFSRGDTVRIISLTNSDTKINDNEIYQYPDLQLRDGSVETGCVMIDTGSGIAAADTWNIGNGSENLSLGALIAKQRLELQREILKQYTGSLITGLGYMYGVQFDGFNWIPSDYQFSCYENVVDATWTAIGIDPETTSTPSEDSPNGDFIHEGGQGFFKYGKAFRVAGETMADDVMFGIVRVSNVRHVVEAWTMDAGQRNNYRLIDASDGGSTSLAITDTVVKLSWSGVNGSYDIEIPEAAEMDGGRMEIILDDSFDGNQTITITPASGSIQGQAAIELNTMGLTIYRAIDPDWW